MTDISDGTLGQDEGRGDRKVQVAARFENVSKRFGETQALDAVTFELAVGEVHALVGENGAGKSTLVKLLGGIHRADSGDVTVRGQSIALESPSDAMKAGIVVIPQEMNVVPAQSVAENVLLSDIPVRRLFGVLPAVDRRAMRDRAAALLERLNFHVDPSTAVGALGHAERQLVMIARALSQDAKLLILDEPTASLEAREVERLFDVIAALKKSGVAIIYVSHRLDEIERLADRVTVLRDGQVVHSGENGAIDRDALIRKITGRDLESLGAHEPLEPGKPLLSNDEVSVSEHQVVGLAGLLGSGTTAMLRRLFGAERTEKPIRLSGVEKYFRSPADAIAGRIGFVPGERRLGLIAGLSVRENILLPQLDKLSGMTGLNKRAADAIVHELVETVDLRPPDPDRLVRTLSGGNQQKVLFARWLAAHVDILLLDEPTHGIDVGAKAQIHRLMRRFAEDGGGVIFASAETLDVVSYSDNVIALRKGDVVARISRDDGDAYSERNLRIALGS